MIGERIKERRAFLGISQGELSRRTGIDQGNLCRWETGVRSVYGPSAATLIALAKALKCSVDFLLDMAPVVDPDREDLP